MCMLSFFPSDITPEAKHLVNGALQNPDGHGWAMVVGSPGNQQLMTRKSMSADEAIETFMATRREHREGPALFHSRIATSGLVDVTGCHPFKVGSDNRTVVGHNGILFSPGPKSLKSDTRIFAETMLPRFGSLDNARKFAKLERFCSGNKLVVLTVNPARRRNAYIINAGLGVWTEGAWHSNFDFEEPYYPKYSAKYRTGTTRTGSSRDLEPWPCDLCGSRDAVNTYTLICEVCGCCNDCQSYKDECMCYYADRLHRDDWESDAVPASELVPGASLAFPDAPARPAAQITARGYLWANGVHTPLAAITSGDGKPNS